MKRVKEPHAKREFAVEYYRQLIHRSPYRRSFCGTKENAIVRAGEHLDRRHYVKAVVVHRPSGLVVCTRLRIGVQNLYQPGDYKAGPVGLMFDLPPLEAA